MTDPAAPGRRSFLALGDSYTIGESVDSHDRWPNQLARALNARGIPVEEPVIIAQTGWTTDELDAAIDAATLYGTYHIVSLLIGVNNQYRGRSVEEYRREFRALLMRAAGFADGGGRVLVLSIPDWGVTPFAAGRDAAQIAREIDAHNAANREETLVAGASYCNVTPASRAASSDPSLIAPDGLHPSGRMYAQWTELALPAAMAILQRS